MAEKSFQEKTEKATPRKRSEARKRGQLAKSREVVSVAVMLAGLSMFSLFGAFMMTHVKVVMDKSFRLVGTPELDLPGLLNLSFEMVVQYIIIVIPVMIAVVAMAIFSNVIQVGFLFTLQPLTPDFSKINPLKGLGRLFSKQAVMELSKSLAKLGIVGLVAYWTVRGELDRFVGLADLEVSGIGLYIFKVMLKIFFRVCLAMIVLAIIDYGFQRWHYEEQLKMTKQEVKEEYKRTEGDPLVKSRIRRVQLEAARRRMMQEVPKADVIVTNPVHLAIAIRYDRAVMSAPQVVAKGAELIAQRIRAIAREHRIPIVENKPLARDLYKNVEIGDEIPSDFYQAVAEVLAYVYRLKGKAA